MSQNSYSPEHVYSFTNYEQASKGSALDSTDEKAAAARRKNADAQKLYRQRKKEQEQEREMESMY